MAKGVLRVPVRLADAYVKHGDEARYFPNVHNYLTLEELLEVFPNGIATSDTFTYNGMTWRLAKRSVGNGNGAVYLAVLDEDQTMQVPSVPKAENGHANHPSWSNHTCTDVVTLNSHNLPSSPTGALCVPFPALSDAITHVTPPPSTAQVRDAERQKVMESLIVANESPMPLDRYKALIRLLAVLRRQQLALNPKARNPLATDTWTDHDVLSFTRDVVMVGESLAKFGTADLAGERSNSSRAITAGDYATLLRCFLEQHGGLFRQPVLEAMPERLSDDATAVGLLLRTRCDANQLIFQALIKSVGLEPNSGSAVVFNNSVVTASPTNHVTANPEISARTAVSAAAAAITQGVKGLPRPVLVVGGVVLLFMARRVLKGMGGGRGGGGGKGRSNGYASDGWHHNSSGRGAPVPHLATRLLSDKTSTERSALRQLTACSAELARARKNSELLANDWRLGPLRLGQPVGATMPTGYEELDMSKCSVDGFLNNLDVIAPHRFDM